MSSINNNPYNLNGASGSSTIAEALITTTNPVEVGAATAPSAGFVLTATSATNANWQSLGPILGLSVLNPASATDSKGLIASGATLQLENADSTHPGILTSGAQSIGGKKIFSTGISDSTNFINDTTNSKAVKFDISAVSASTTTTLKPTSTVNRTLTLPDLTDNIVSRTSVDTLTNKTLTAPVISSIVNTGTLTLPTSTDTLVGRNTTDTLFNKSLITPSLSAPTIAQPQFSVINTTNASATLTANSTNHIILSSGSGYSYALPSSPSDGNVVNISDANGTFDTQQPTLTCVGPTVIVGSEITPAGVSSYTMNQKNGWYILMYQSNSNVWTLRSNLNWADFTASAMETFTNKTITDSTNTVAANSLKSATTLVNVSSATAPTSGQILTATSGTAATWQTPASTSLTVSAPVTASDNNGVIVSGSNIQLEFATSTRPGLVSTGAQTFPGTKQILIQDNSSILNSADFSKRVQIDCSGITASVTGVLKPTFTTAKTLSFPDLTDTLVSKTSVDTLTNKTITSSTNTVAANSLKSATTLVDVSAATAPTSGQVLQATDSTHATWQTLSAGISMTTPIAATDSNGAVISAGTLAMELADNTHPGIVSTAAQTFAGAKTFSTAPVISSITNTGTLTLPTSTDTLIGRNTTDQLTNKSIVDAGNFMVNVVDNTKKVNWDLSTITTGTTRTISIPDASDTLVNTSSAQVLTNKTFTDNSFILQDNADNTKKAQFELSTLTTGTTRSYTLPNANDQLVGKDTNIVMSNKRFLDSSFFLLDSTDQTKALQFNVAGDTGQTSTLTFVPTGGAKTWTLPNATTTLDGVDNTSTLTNKTLISTTNNVAANSLKSATTLIDVVSATAPTAGQVLTAVDSTHATWQTNLATFSVGAPVAASDSNALIWASNTLQAEFADATHPGIVSSSGSQIFGGIKTLNINDNSFVQNHVDNTKQLKFQISGNTGTTMTINSSPTANRILGLPDTDDTLCAVNLAQTLTNKTMTSNTNNITASGLFTGSGSGTVSISAATAPTAGQLLVATSGSTATWQSASGCLTIGSPAAATDNNGATITGGTLNMEFADATHNGILSTTSQTISGSKTLNAITDASTFVSVSDDTRKAQFSCNSIAPGHTSSIIIPNSSGTLVLTSTAQTVSNKTLLVNTTVLADSIDATKRAILFASQISTGTTRNFIFPDIDSQFLTVSKTDSESITWFGPFTTNITVIVRYMIYQNTLVFFELPEIKGACNNSNIITNTPNFNANYRPLRDYTFTGGRTTSASNIGMAMVYIHSNGSIVITNNDAAGFDLNFNSSGTNGTIGVNMFHWFII